MMHDLKLFRRTFAIDANRWCFSLLFFHTFWFCWLIKYRYSYVRIDACKEGWHHCWHQEWSSLISNALTTWTSIELGGRYMRWLVIVSNYEAILEKLQYVSSCFHWFPHLRCRNTTLSNTKLLRILAGRADVAYSSIIFNLTNNGVALPKIG